MYYYGARFYAAWIGKFISIDPLAEKFPQLTPYNYAGNKPITYKDLHGLQSSGGDVEVKTTPKQEGEKSTETVSYINALDGIEQEISKTVYYHSGFLGKEDNYSEKEYRELFRPLIRSIGQGQEDMCILTDLEIADEMYTKLSDWAEEAYNYYGGQIPLARGNVDAMGYDSPFFLIGGSRKLFNLATGTSSKSTKGLLMYRAVDVTEETIIRNTGKFSLQEGGLEVKYFAKSIDDANWYGKALYPNGYKVIKAELPNSINSSQYWYPNIDIGAYVLPKEIIPYVTPK
ncbi:RHS repeat-associated core domain-containing protein [Mesonia sp. K4-1]|uniref:RHS repeat-associated core domain-containing protein n=1 Tax=Mesonia sp. K4-1 TaxID=2602760 RepID=UPI0011C73257|nr:RHS repeat-associated core domain-containing protein [Mesonia sp. K4-1]TXK77153.1 hypothetical protein FT986_05030 [Mesonia sp. K4-1]